MAAPERPPSTAGVQELRKDAILRQVADQDALQDYYRQQVNDWGEAQVGQTSFAGGEISAQAEGRVDLDVYRVALRRALNMQVRKQGAIQNRSGMEWLSYCGRIAGQAGTDYHLMPFVLTEDESYVLACDDQPGRGGFITPFRRGVAPGYTADWAPITRPARDLDIIVASAGPGLPTQIALVSGLTQPIHDRTDIFITGVPVVGGVPIAPLVNDKWFAGWHRAVVGSEADVVDARTVRGERTRIGITAGVIAGYTVGTYVRFVPRVGFTRDNVPVGWRHLLTGNFRTIVQNAGAGTEYIEIEAADRSLVTYHRDIDSRAWEDPGAVATFLRIERLEMNVILFDVDTTGTFSLTPVPGTPPYPTVTPVLHIPSRVTTADLRLAHIAQHDESLIVVGRTFIPFEVWRSDTNIGAEVSFEAVEFESERRFFATSGTARSPYYVRAPKGLTFTYSGAGVAGLLRYSYRVTAVHTLGTESFASEINPTIAAVIAAGNGFNITWNISNDPDIVSYRVYRYDSATAAHLLLNNPVKGAGPTQTYLDVAPSPFAATAPLLDRSPAKRVAAFSVAGDYPGAVAYSDQRLALGGTTNDPGIALVSEVADFTNFTKTEPSLDIINDASAIKLDVSASTTIAVRALVSLSHLMAMGDAAEIRIGQPEGGALTPTSVSARPQSHNGSGSLQPKIIEDTLLYVQRKGNIIRDLRYNADGLAGASYGGREVSVLAEHLIDGRTIVDWSYADEPNQVLYIAFSDGTACSLTYSREHKIVAFCPIETAGQILSISVVPEGAGNGVYMAVRRKLGAVTRVWIERLREREDVDVEMSVFLDSCRVFLQPLIAVVSTAFTASQYRITFGASHGLVTGDIIDVRLAEQVGALDQLVPHEHANGQYRVENVAGNEFRLQDPQTLLAINTAGWVAIVGPGGTAVSLDVRETVDAMPATQQLVNVTDVGMLANGKVVTPTMIPATGATNPVGLRFSKAILGRRFRSIVETLPLHHAGQGRRQMGTQRRPGLLAYRLVRSAGMLFGMRLDALTPRKERTAEDWYEPTRLFTGVDEQLVGEYWHDEATVLVVQDEPLPLTVGGLYPGVIAGDL